MKTRFSPRLIIATLVFSLGLGGAALAKGFDGERCGSPGERMEQRMGHGMKEISRLHDDLKLDAKQEAAWQEAANATKNTMGGMRDQMRQQREEIQAALNQPAADLRAIAKRMDELRDAARKQHEANRDRWLAVYDLLNVEQKEKARLFFKTKLQKIEGMGRGQHGHR